MQLIPIPKSIANDFYCIFIFIWTCILYPELCKDDCKEIFCRFCAAELHKSTTKKKPFWSLSDLMKILPHFSLDDIVKISGSFGGIEGLEREEKKRMAKAEIVAKILTLIYACDYNGIEGSVKKSVFILSKQTGKSPAYLKKIWSNYKCCAHFCAGFTLMYTAMAHDKELFYLIDNNFTAYKAHILAYWLNSFHCVSKYYNYAVNRIEKRTNSPLIDKGLAWLFPPEIVKGSSHLLSNPVYDNFRDEIMDQANSAKYNSIRDVTIDDETKRLIETYRAPLSS